MKESIPLARFRFYAWVHWLKTGGVEGENPMFYDRDTEVLIDNDGKVHVYKNDDKKELKLEPKPRPEILPSATMGQKIGCGKLYMHISFDEDGNPFEIFIQTKAGDCTNAQLEPIGKLASHMLRCGIDVNIVLECLKDVRCPAPYLKDLYKKKQMMEKGVPQHINSNGEALSCSDGIYHAIKKALKSKGWIEENGLMVKGEISEVTA